MRKIFLFTLILLCVMCAGCFQGNTNLIITDDGKVFLRNKFIGVPLVAEQIESFKNNFAQNPDAEISPVVENNMSGYEIRVNWPNVKSFASENFSLFAAHKDKCAGIQQRTGWFFDAYKFDLMSTGEQSLSPSEAAAVQSVLSQVSYDLTIELPHAAENHNADRFDAAQKILTWNLATSLLSGQDKHLRVEFKLWHRGKIFLTALVELLLLAAGIFFHVKRKSAASDGIAAGLTFKRNIFAGLFVALALVSAYMIFAPVTFTPADTISVTMP